MSQRPPFINSYVEQQYEHHLARARKFKLVPLFHKLLSFGGEYVVLGSIETSKRRLNIARRVQNALSHTLVTKDDIACGTASFHPMVPKRCHWNVAALYLTCKIDKIATGFVLTKLETHTYWLAHTWGIKDGKVIETTDANKDALMYYGIVLTDKEAKRTVGAMASSKPELLNESLYTALTINLKVSPRS